MRDTPETERLQRKFRNLAAQMDLLASALADLRREASNVSAAAWEAIEAAEAEQGTEKPVLALVDMRDPECVKAWPECETFGSDPRCCRFPKSCSAGSWVPVDQPASTPGVETRTPNRPNGSER